MAARISSHLFGWTNELLVGNIKIWLKIFYAASISKNKPDQSLSEPLKSNSMQRRYKKLKEKK